LPTWQRKVVISSKDGYDVGVCLDITHVTMIFSTPMYHPILIIHNKNIGSPSFSVKILPAEGGFKETKGNKKKTRGREQMMTFVLISNYIESVWCH